MWPSLQQPPASTLPPSSSAADRGGSAIIMLVPSPCSSRPQGGPPQPAARTIGTTPHHACPSPPNDSACLPSGPLLLLLRLLGGAWPTGRGVGRGGGPLEPGLSRRPHPPAPTPPAMRTAGRYDHGGRRKGEHPLISQLLPHAALPVSPALPRLRINQLMPPPHHRLLSCRPGAVRCVWAGLLLRISAGAPGGPHPAAASLHGSEEALPAGEWRP